MQPVMIREPHKSQSNIGFVARREIGAGEELFFDYGIKDPDTPWIKTYAKKIATTLPKIMPQMQTMATRKPRLLPKEENLIAQYWAMQQLIYKTGRSHKESAF